MKKIVMTSSNVGYTYTVCRAQVPAFLRSRSYLVFSWPRHKLLVVSFWNLFDVDPFVVNFYLNDIPYWTTVSELMKLVRDVSCMKFFRDFQWLLFCSEVCMRSQPNEKTSKIILSEIITPTALFNGVQHSLVYFYKNFKLFLWFLHWSYFRGHFI